MKSIFHISMASSFPLKTPKEGGGGAEREGVGGGGYGFSMAHDI